MSNHITRELIEQTAATLGARKHAVKKWRYRRVPYEWRVKITRELMSRGVLVSLDDFDNLEKGKPNA